MWWLVFFTSARIVVLKKDICGRRWVLIRSTGDQGGAGMLQHVPSPNMHPNRCYSTALRTIRVHVSNERMKKRLERLGYYFIKGQIWKNVGANWKTTGTSSFIPSLVDIRRKSRIKRRKLLQTLLSDVCTAHFFSVICPRGLYLGPCLANKWISIKARRADRPTWAWVRRSGQGLSMFFKVLLQFRWDGTACHLNTCQHFWKGNGESRSRKTFHNSTAFFHDALQTPTVKNALLFFMIGGCDHHFALPPGHTHP